MSGIELKTALHFPEGASRISAVIYWVILSLTLIALCLTFTSQLDFFTARGGYSYAELNPIGFILKSFDSSIILFMMTLALFLRSPSSIWLLWIFTLVDLLPAVNLLPGGGGRFCATQMVFYFTIAVLLTFLLLYLTRTRQIGPR